MKGINQIPTTLMSLVFFDLWVILGSSKARRLKMLHFFTAIAYGWKWWED
jgi:hypothetical protein